MTQPLLHLEPLRRWEFAQPLVYQPLSDERLLVIHPPSGAWVMVSASDRELIDALAAAANSGQLDVIRTEDAGQLVPFERAGLLLRDPWRRPPLPSPPEGISLLILKMVGHCNLACTYCYDYNSVTYRRQLSAANARQAITQAIDLAGPTLRLLFHGGEPLLALDHMRELTVFARAEADKRGKVLQLSVQTNGTRFSPEAVAFLLREHFDIGLSIDGPPEMHDRHRVDHAGRGSHARIEEALRTYPELCARMGVLTTVTRDNVGALPQVARYVRDLGIATWDISVFQGAGRGEQEPARFAPDSGALIHAYVELLDGIEAGDYDDLEVCPVLHYLRNILFASRSNMCLRGGGCGAARELMSIDVDGRIDACDCIQEPGLRLGSLESVSLAEARSSDVARSIRARSEATLIPCASCDVRAFCGGTCLAKAGHLSGISEEECALSLAVIPDIFGRLAQSDRLERYAQRYP